MAIFLSNDTVAASAPAGTIVGSLSESRGAAQFSIWGGSGEFAIIGSNLVTAWSGVLRPGNYSVIVFARVSSFFPFDIAAFTISVTSASQETGSFNPAHAVISTKP